MESQENVGKNEDRIKERLTKEIENEIKTSCRPLFERREELANDLKKLKELSAAKKLRLQEVKQLLLQNGEMLKTSKPAGIPDLSRIKAELSKEKTEIESVLVDLGTSTIADDLKVTEEALRLAVCEFMEGWRNQKDRELSLQINYIERLIIERHETARAVFAALRVPPVEGLCRAEFFSPLLSRACDNRYPRLMQLWESHQPKPAQTKPIAEAIGGAKSAEPVQPAPEARFNRDIFVQNNPRVRVGP